MATGGGGRALGRAVWRSVLRRVADAVPPVRSARKELGDRQAQVRRLTAQLRRSEHRADELQRRARVAEARVGRLRADRAELRRAARRPAPPSFGYKLSEMRRREERFRRAYGTDHPVWAVNDKDAGRALATRLGLGVPALLASARSFEDLDLSALPDRFVLKPTGGTNSRGVFTLRREADGFVELAYGDHLDEEELRKRYAEWLSAGAVKLPILVEELLEVPELPGVPAPDWKVFCFGDRVGMVMERLRRPGPAGRPELRFKYWDDHWDVLPDARADGVMDPALPPPYHPEELLRAARLLAGEFRRSHVRVDLFDLPDRVVFGEMSPTAGHMAMRPAVDEYLGTIWEEHEADLYFRGESQSQ